jgi:site-specific recombinase XerD
MSEDLQLKGYSPKTEQAYLYAVQKLAGHYHKSPALLTEEELRAYFLHLTQVEHCAAGTLRIAVSGVKFCFGVTLQRHWPVLGLIRACKQKTLPVVLSRAEVREVLGCVWTPVYRVCLKTIYACGLRISEGAALQVADVDGRRKLLRVRGKGNKERQVPLAEPALEWLRAFWKTHRSESWLFPARLQPRSANQQGPVAVSNLQRAFRAALAQSGINKPATVHSLRHSYATHLLEAGVQLRLIQEVLGHRSPSTTAIYTHLTAQVRAQMVEPLQALAAVL